MGNGLSKWSSLCTFYIKMDPLVVSSSICEHLYLFLGDGDVVAVTQMLSNVGHEVCLVFNDRCHYLSVADTGALIRTKARRLAEPYLLM
jgi:hypothetical protein